MCVLGGGGEVALAIFSVGEVSTFSGMIHYSFLKGHLMQPPYDFCLIMEYSNS